MCGLLGIFKCKFSRTILWKTVKRKLQETYKNRFKVQLLILRDIQLLIIYKKYFKMITIDVKTKIRTSNKENVQE